MNETSGVFWMLLVSTYIATYILVVGRKRRFLDSEMPKLEMIKSVVHWQFKIYSLIFHWKSMVMNFQRWGHFLQIKRPPAPLAIGHKATIGFGSDENYLKKVYARNEMCGSLGQDHVGMV